MVSYEMRYVLINDPCLYLTIADIYCLVLCRCWAFDCATFFEIRNGLVNSRPILLSFFLSKGPQNDQTESEPKQATSLLSACELACTSNFSVPNFQLASALLRFGLQHTTPYYNTIPFPPRYHR